ncbi:hypothetical protein D0838_07025 [Bordetella avium]|uniref:hypothetical protein n=1 Tax=Bordetella avium TaxID=521 RepID=UPI000E6A240D|nr:hypothetical protein [Bordetella avium]RIQ74908.1 hypothetical protein D0838_07025 [Bordetella avium]
MIQASPVPFNPPSPASLTRKMLAGLFLSAPLYLHIPIALASDGAPAVVQGDQHDAAPTEKEGSAKTEEGEAEAKEGQDQQAAQGGVPDAQDTLPYHAKYHR